MKLTTELSQVLLQTPFKSKGISTYTVTVYLGGQTPKK